MNLELHDVPAVAAALAAAHAGGLLAALVERPGSPVDFAARCHLDQRACTHVLDVLDACGLTTRDGDRYGAGPELIEQAARPLPLEQLDSELWRHAPTFLRTGTPLITMDAAPAEREKLYRDVVPELGKLFAAAAEQLAERCGLTPESILDVGCGSGVWSLAIAQRLPKARVTGVDLVAVLDRFRARAASLGMSDRIATIEGDMHSVSLPDGQWDLAIIANVLRLEQTEAARSLVKRTARALRPGGSMLVVDSLAGGNPAAERARAIYGFHLAMRTRSGRVHTPVEIGQWMKEAGCEAPTEITFGEQYQFVGALGALTARKI